MQYQRKLQENADRHVTREASVRARMRIFTKRVFCVIIGGGTVFEFPAEGI